jgi:hypothetical protein
VKTALTSLVAIAASLSLLCGCATPPVVVSDSQLNWLQITRRSADENILQSRINLIGVGYIEFIEGRSPRVTNAFSQDVGNAQWQDVYQEKLGVHPDVIRDWLQLFVDAGVMDSSKNKVSKNNEAKETVLFQANINREKAICVTDDEELLRLVHKLIDVIKLHGNRRERK